jgi:hypothetical protein
MSVKLRGASGVEADVDVDKQLFTRLNDDPKKSGSLTIFSEKDDGAITGIRKLMSPEVSGDYRQRSGIDTILDSEIFCYASQNTSKHFYRFTTMTADLNAGSLRLNALGVNTTSIGMAFSTNKYFPLVNAAPLYIETIMSLPAIVGANTVLDFGGIIPGAANPYAPTDGAFFRWNASGLFGVLTNNGAETTVGPVPFMPTLNKSYHHVIVTDQDHVEFWIDNQLYGEIATPNSLGGPFLSGSVPWCVRMAHVGGAAGQIIQPRIYAYGVSLGDFATNKAWPAQMSGMGGQGAQGQSGGTQGSTHIFPANSAAVTTTVPTNTTNTANGLGGRVQVALVASATTDFILYGFQVPAGTAVVPGKSLYLKRVKITGAVTTALVAPTAGIPLVSFDLGYGSTAASLATTESASFAATTKKARLIPLGFMQFSGNVQTVTAPVAGSVGNELDFDFEAPIVVNPGEWVQVVMRCVNCGAGGLVSFAASFNTYWE